MKYFPEILIASLYFGAAVFVFTGHEGAAKFAGVAGSMFAIGYGLNCVLQK